jgi:sugar O-acyltransferase (sialic acid O-acetyltransferase NeuD family)
MERIFVYGAGGQGKVVIDALRWNLPQYDVGVLVDDDLRQQGKTVLGHRVTSPRDIGTERGFIAIGDNASRLRIGALHEGRLVVVTHRNAVVGMSAEIGEGSILAAGSIVAPCTRIGRNVILNTASTVDHDCVIEDGVHIAPGSHLCGNVRVGRGALLGAGTIVVPGVRIGAGAFIHAGLTVTRDVPEGETVRAPRPRPTERKPVPDPIAP